MDLYPHQQEGIKFLKDKLRGALHFTMRLGKTRTILEVINNLGSDALPVVIVCPLSAFDGWQKEVREQTSFTLTTLSGSIKERYALIEQSPKTDLYLINYDGIRIPGMADKILKVLEPKALILDEAHRCKTASTSQWQACKIIADKVKYVYELTGTPITQKPTDIWSQFQIMIPGFFQNAYAFDAEYCKFQQMLIPIRGGGKRGIRKYVGPRHANELAAKVAQYALRKTAEECIKLPEIVREKITCPLTPEQQKHYQAFRTSLATHLEGEKGNDKQVLVDYAAALVQKLRQVCQGFIYTETISGERETHRLSSGKVAMLLDLLEDLAGEKVVIFTDFIEDRVRLFEEILKGKTGHIPIVFEGDAENRAKALSRFRVAGEATVLIANIQSASEGVDLSVASHCVYFGNTYSHAVRTQSEARCLHPTKKQPVTLYDFVVPNTVDEIILKILSLKADTAAKITGDKIRLAKIITGQDRI